MVSERENNSSGVFYGKALCEAKIYCEAGISDILVHTLLERACMYYKQASCKVKMAVKQVGKYDTSSDRKRESGILVVW